MSGPRVTIVDYGRGNLFSMARALEHIGAAAEITDCPNALRSAEALVVPGVGAFRDAMASLATRGLDLVLREVAARGVPMLGVCLGMQVLFSRSEEFGDSEGLDLIGGTVERLPDPIDGPGRLRIPNVGWRPVVRQRPCPLLEQVSQDAMFYFVHSYVPVPARSADIVATLEVNGMRAAVMVQRGNVFGCQFHPEKSGPEGLALLRGFVLHAESQKPRRQVA